MGPDAFDYSLPPEQVAQAPAPRRSSSRMLVVGPPHTHAQAGELAGHLAAGAVVVVNKSRVVPARLLARRPDGREFELLMCAPASAQGPGSIVAAWVRGARRLRLDDRLSVGDLVLRSHDADPVDPRARRFEVEAGDVLAACRTAGSIPLPPYITRPHGPTAADRERYQTVFARTGHDGSVAAPTAGLHFDAALIAQIEPVGITLHVGPGTFLPMDVADVRTHRVGAERIEIDEAAADTIERARRDGRPIVAVGTTVTRALEAVARARGTVAPFRGTTDLVITPGFRFAVVTGLLTNFHLPRSSLLMLTCSFGGRERVLAAYREAVRLGYRFYSYGDCMLLDRRDEG